MPEHDPFRGTPPPDGTRLAAQPGARQQQQAPAEPDGDLLALLRTPVADLLDYARDAGRDETVRLRAAEAARTDREPRRTLLDGLDDLLR